MFDLVNGLPVHALVVHAVVVLVPLAALGATAIAVRRTWRKRYGVLVAAAAALGAVLTPVATSSGEALERRVGDPGTHAALGDQLIWFVIPLLVLVLALVALDRRGSTGSTVLRVVSALVVVAALATTVQVVRIGDSGARAAWGDQVSARTPQDQDGNPQR